MAWARWATWSFMKMLLAWLRTVLVETPSSRAISAFSRPAAMSAEDLALPVGQLREHFGPGLRPLAAEVGRDPLGDAGAEDDLAGADRLDRAHDLGAPRPLEQIAPGTRPQRREDRVVVLQHGEHDDADVR